MSMGNRTLPTYYREQNHHTITLYYHKLDTSVPFIHQLAIHSGTTHTTSLCNNMYEQVPATSINRHIQLMPTQSSLPTEKAKSTLLCLTLLHLREITRDPHTQIS